MRRRVGLAVIIVMGCTFQLLADDAQNKKLGTADVRTSIGKAIPLLEKASAGTADQRKCFTCHGQALPVMALVEARDRGFEVDEQNLARQLRHTRDHLARGRENYLKGKGQGGRVDTAGYALWALEAGADGADGVTNAVVHYLLVANKDEGYWKRSSNRPPSEASDFTATYVALRGLRAFATDEQRAEAEERTKRAREWLIQAKAADTEDKVFRLRAAYVVEMDEEQVKDYTQELIGLQRDDGGWSQKPDMDSDAYATGSVLTALARTNPSMIDQPAYRRGLRYLLGTQRADGSWYVKSRSKPFQTYFESGFPHGKDQFISTDATAWATLALLLALPKGK